MKVFLIILGSLVALGVLVVSLFAFLVVPKFVESVKNDQSPAAQHKVAASIANFDIPPGYKQLFGTNLFVISMVTLTPIDAKHRHFAIILEGINVPSAAVEAKNAQYEQGIKRGLAAQCKDFRSDSDEVIKAKSQSIALHIMRCADAGKDLKMAFAIFPGTSKLATLTATGDSSDFDLVAVRKLLASVH